jgi:ABC-type nitrate/sulfonate/bicarbonate transport system permease component
MDAEAAASSPHEAETGRQGKAAPAITQTTERGGLGHRALDVLFFMPRLATLVALIVLWQLVSAVWLPRYDPYMAVLMPPPALVFTTGVELIKSGDLGWHLADSLKREGVAFLFALTAVPLGLLMGWFRPLHDQLDPVVEVLRPIPPLAWIPLSILWFGVGDEQNEFIIFLGMFFPILINTIDGVRRVDGVMVRAARSLGANEFAVLKRVVLKAALPQIVTGIRVGVGFGWMALVAAELVGASSGLGFMINDARSVLRTDIIVVGMITIGVVGLTIDMAIRLAMRRLLPWSVAEAR